MRKLVIAIDGPSGVGKGTVARALAESLGYRHVDSGAMYRAVGWQAMVRGISLEDEAAVASLTRDARIDVNGGHVVIDGTDITHAIRTPAIDKAAASVARLATVRALLVARQRQFGDGGGIVMEGRDIGTVVFPGADVKIYLDATPEERARRRASDPAHSVSPLGVAEVASALTARDESDRTRHASPLYAAPDATVIDTTTKPIETVVAEVMAIVTRTINRAG